MNITCVFTYTDELNIENSVISIYSFLERNAWFIGDIFISSKPNVITDETKYYLTNLYNKIFFIEDENIASIDDGFTYFCNDYKYDEVLFIENDVIVNDNIEYYLNNKPVYFNIKDIDSDICFYSIDVTESNKKDAKVIIYDGECDGYGAIIRDSFLNEINNGGPFYNFKITEGTERFHKDFNDRDKYVVCACAKNENDYIVEWVNHYLNLGFDKIFICDNNEKDDDSIYEILNEYIQSGVVEIFDCRKFSCFQVQFYAMFCTIGNYKWCAYFDCDEFLEIPSYFDIKHYLSTKENELCVSFNWMIYGSNNHITKTEGPIQERFKYPVKPVSLFTENVFIKSIVKGRGIFNKGCWFNGSHMPLTTPMIMHNIGGYFQTESDRHCYFPPRYKEGYLKHYYTKSFNEWVKKSRRGWPDGTDELVLANYFICDDWFDFPLEKMRLGLFSEYKDKTTLYEYYKPMITKSDILNIENKSGNIYGLIIGMYNLMSICEGYVFMLGDKHIDDTAYNILLEIGFKTGNKVVWAETEEEKMNVVSKYSKISDTYYNINFK